MGNDSEATKHATGQWADVHQIRQAYCVSTERMVKANDTVTEDQRRRGFKCITCQQPVSYVVSHKRKMKDSDDCTTVQPHFRHLKNADCPLIQKYKAGESDEHFQAKFSIKEVKGFYQQCSAEGCRHILKRYYLDSNWVHQVEQRLEGAGYIYDAVFYDDSGHPKFVVEIKHTNAISYDKQKWLRDRPFPYVEVNACDVQKGAFVPVLTCSAESRRCAGCEFDLKQDWWLGQKTSVLAFVRKHAPELSHTLKYCLLSALSPSLRGDKQVVEILVAGRLCTFKSASDRLRSDKDFVLKLCKQGYGDVVLKGILFKSRIKQLVPHGKGFIGQYSGFIGKYSGICGICQSQLKGTRIVCLSTRQKHTSSKQQERQPSEQTHSQSKIYMHAKCVHNREKRKQKSQRTDEIFSWREVFVAAVRANSDLNFIRDVPKILQRDKELMLAYLRKDICDHVSGLPPLGTGTMKVDYGWMDGEPNDDNWFSHIHPSLRKDTEIMMAVAACDPFMALRSADDSLKVNVDFVINTLEKMQQMQIQYDGIHGADENTIEHVSPSHHCNERVIELCKLMKEYEESR